MALTPAQLRAMKATPGVGARGGNPRPTADTLERNPQIRAQYLNTPAPTPRPGPGPAPAPAPVSGGGGGKERTPNIRWDDAAYNAQIAAIDRALRDFETGLATRGQRYGEDFTRGVRDLGFRAGEGFVAAPDILGFRNLEEGLQAVRRPMARTMGEDGQETPMTAAQMLGGQWDYEGEFNPFSAASRGTRTSRDEFAGRGTLRSSDFAKSYAEFQDRLNQQLEAMETGRGRFFEDALTNLSSQRASAEERRAAAQRDAMMRAAIMAAR